MATLREWFEDTSSRESVFTYCNGEHVSLPELIEERHDNGYLWKKNIPNYHESVFSVSKVRHITNLKGLHGIIEDAGFRGYNSYLWWDLSVTPDDCVSANFPNSQELSWQSPNQIPFLESFTTSPAFQSKSLYGNFCFTFPIREILNLYSKQHCRRTAPILRVKDTRLYQQEIQYSVLVHPKYMTHYRKYPRLPIQDNFLCGYSQGEMSWCCQSPSNKYEYSLEVDQEGGDMYLRNLESPEYYVWDHVTMAFHMKKNWLLRVGRKRLFDSLMECEMASNVPEMSVEEAKEEIETLKKKYHMT